MIENKEYTITFRNKEMNLLEAKLYLQNLKDGKVKLELTEEEIKSYNELKKSLEHFNQKKCNEQDYLIFVLDFSISAKELFDKQNNCTNYEHKMAEFSNLPWSGKLNTCPNCGGRYLERMTPDEIKDWNDLKNSPFTI
jgi:hypothetical protein